MEENENNQTTTHSQEITTWICAHLLLPKNTKRKERGNWENILVFNIQ